MSLRVYKSVDSEFGFPLLVTSSKVHFVGKVVKVHDLIPMRSSKLAIVSKFLLTVPKVFTKVNCFSKSPVTFRIRRQILKSTPLE